jgi:hypothetical protein
VIVCVLEAKLGLRFAFVHATAPTDYGVQALALVESVNREYRDWKVPLWRRTLELTRMIRTSS